MTGPFPEDSVERKTYPVHSGVMRYFPAALARVAHHSYLGNEKHNPGESLHWARGKSDDHLDAAGRHLIEGDLAGAAWRILAALQLQCEAEGAPMAPGARVSHVDVAILPNGGTRTRNRFAPGYPCGGYVGSNPISQADEE